MDYAVDILNQYFNEWNKLTKKEKEKYLEQYVKRNKRKRATRNDR